MRDILFLVGLGIIKLLVGMLVVLRYIAVGVVWGCAQLVQRLSGKRAQTARKKATQAAAVVRVDVKQTEAEAGAAIAEAVKGPTTVFMNDFEAADRIISMRLDPPVGSIHLRVYRNAKRVKRELIVSEPRLRGLLGARRIDLEDVPYDPALGLEDIKEATVRSAEDLINAKGNARVRAIKPPKVDFERTVKLPVKPAAGNAPAPQPTAQKQAAPASQPPLPPAQQPRGRLAVPTVQTGVTYEGELIAAGTKRVTPLNRPAYEVFEATLRLTNGAEMALRGAELERALVKAGCDLGNRVAVTQMGKVDVELGDGSQGKKNLYAVANLSNPTRG